MRVLGNRAEEFSVCLQTSQSRAGLLLLIGGSVKAFSSGYSHDSLQQPNNGCRIRPKALALSFQVLYSLEGVGVMVLAKFRSAFLPERGAVAGGLGLYSLSGQPGNRTVYGGLRASSLCSLLLSAHRTDFLQCLVLPAWLLLLLIFFPFVEGTVHTEEVRDCVLYTNTE